MTPALPALIPSRQERCSLAAIELAKRTGVSVELRKLEALTEELFSKDYVVDVHHDPEIADFSTIVFSVVVAAPLEDALARQDLWIARLIEIMPDRPGRFCLSLSDSGAETSVTDVNRLAERHGALEQLVLVESATSELFPGEFSVEVQHDSEIPDYSSIVFCVSFRGTTEEAARRNRHWHERLVELAPRLPALFCLSIDMSAE